MRKVLKEKADAAGVDFEAVQEGFEDLKEETTGDMDDEELKSKQLKNLSLAIVSVTAPQGIMDLFEHVMKQHQTHGRKIFVDELIFMLFFYK